MNSEATGPERISSTAVQTRLETAGDVAAVDALIERAFDGRPNEVELVRQLRGSKERVYSYVATLEGRVVAHAMYSPLGLEGREETVVTLAPVSVAPEAQGKGVGTKLVTDSLAELDRQGEPLIAVLGDPKYYSRFGFESAVRHGIQAPDGVPMANLMVRPLTHYDSALRGRLVYPQVFTETGTI